MLVDSHCHLDFKDFEVDFTDVMARATRAGVGRMVTISTRMSTFPDVLKIAESHENLFCSVGVHPHEADEEGLSSAAPLVEKSQHPKVIAIGETGLDYYYEHSDREAQKQNFISHIEACRQTQLPLIVHARDADADTIRILQTEATKGAFPGVIHCFTASWALAEAALALGFYISFSGIVTFKSAKDLQETAKRVPGDRILVETDAPYLAPVPNRGKRNEPAYVVHTADFVAGLRGEPAARFATQTTENFFQLFQKAA